MAAYTSFTELKVGQVFPDPAARFDVTEASVDAYLGATEDSAEIYRKKDGPRPAPPTLAAVYMLDALSHFRNPPGGIHTKQSFVFHQPAYVGDTLSTQARILETYVKKERNYVVMEIVTHNQKKALVTTGVITRIWGKEA